ncbi:PTS fructose transporter subunit IIA [Pantoea sp. Acro-835]|uniref:PTS fructose transporter subunit IIA n=1 Tax=Candidatus Pantoea multigeneris TaxID=2608357 RepID=A0ABX0RCX8_9GAMM|nr:PTS fructose transporter subunit IIA [Pantoea multigeneris]
MKPPFEIIAVGQYVAEFLREGKVILFSQPLPQELADYCVVINRLPDGETLYPGRSLQIGQQWREISAVGEVANANFTRLGHVTLSFDGANNAELPGTVHLTGPVPEFLQVGDKIRLSS